MKNKKKPILKKTVKPQIETCSVDGKSRCVLCYIVIIGILTIWAMVLVKNYNFNPFTMFWWPQICNQDSCINVTKQKLWDNESEELHSAQNLTKERWILFEFPSSDIYWLVMLDVITNVDMVWLDEEYRILYIKNNAAPCSANPCPTFSSPFQSKYILELNWWEASEKNYKIWDQLKFK